MDGNRLTAADIAGALTARTYLYKDEADLHTKLISVLDAAGIPVVHEARIDDRNRPDLVCGAVCVEVKIAGDAVAVFKQLQRYAQLPGVDELLLVTTVADHQTLPGTVGGKQLTVVKIGGPW